MFREHGTWIRTGNREQGTRNTEHGTQNTEQGTDNMRFQNFGLIEQKDKV